MKSINTREENGFTLNEMLVVMIVGGLVIGLGLSVFTFSNKLYYSWQRKTVLRTTAEHTLQIIANDIMKSSDVISVSDSSLILQYGIDPPIEYFFNNGQVLRNGEPITSPETSSVRINVSRSSGLPQSRIRIEITVRSYNGSAEYIARSEVSPKESARAQFTRTLLR